MAVIDWNYRLSANELESFHFSQTLFIPVACIFHDRDLNVLLTDVLEVPEA